MKMILILLDARNSTRAKIRQNASLASVIVLFIVWYMLQILKGNQETKDGNLAETGFCGNVLN